MYIYCEDDRKKALVELGSGVNLKENLLNFNDHAPTVVSSSRDPEELSERVKDIRDALVANLAVYDATQEVGYWKEEHSTTKRKPGPKPKAE